MSTDQIPKLKEHSKWNCGVVRQAFEKLSSAESVGTAVEAVRQKTQHKQSDSNPWQPMATVLQVVVTKYGAPHLRPTDIQSRKVLGKLQPHFWNEPPSS